MTKTTNSSPILSIQAKKFHNDLDTDNPSDFVVSKGWLPCFQCHDGISQVKITNEARSADTTAADDLVPIKRNTQQTMT